VGSVFFLIWRDGLTFYFSENIMQHECMKLIRPSMIAEMIENSTVKCVGSSGQISLGKEFAGRKVLVESPAKGVWIIRTASVVPDNEAWLREPSNKASLKRAIAWAAKNPPRASDPDQLSIAKPNVSKRKVRSA
jgi:hypothetical protein